MTKKKILIDAREFTSQPTGIRMMLKHLISGLCQTDTYEVIVALNQNSSVASVFDIPPPNLRAVKIREYLTQIYDQITLKKIAESEKVDFFYSPYPKLPIFLDSCFKVSSILDLTCLSDKFSDLNVFEKNIYKKFLLNCYSSHSDAIVTLSETVLNEISARLGISKEKISVVYPSVDNIFRPQPKDKVTEIGEKYNIPPGSYILYVGNRRAHKNFHTLKNAYHLLPPDVRKKFPLVAIGTNDKHYAVGAENIILLNQIPMSDLPAIYSGAALFVFPSLSEGFGLPPLEAMACGCPVAASNLSSMPEILCDAPLYFDPYSPESIANTIMQVIEDVRTRQHLIEKGFRRAAFFTPQKTFEMFEKILLKHWDL